MHHGALVIGGRNILVVGSQSSANTTFFFQGAANQLADKFSGVSLRFAQNSSAPKHMALLTVQLIKTLYFVTKHSSQ